MAENRETPEYGTAAGAPRPGQDAEVFDLDAARGLREWLNDRADGPTSSDQDDEPAAPTSEQEDDAPREGLIVPATAGPGGAAVDLVDAESQALPVRSRWSLSGLRDAERAEIVPSWLKSRTEVGANVMWAAGLVGHTTAYHGLRTPKYAWRVTFWAPRGAARVVRAYVRWLFDAEGEPVRQSVVRAAVTRPDEARTYDRLANHRDRRVRWRGIVTTFLAALAVAAFVAAFFVPTWALVLAALVAVTVLAVVGAPADRALLDTAVTRTGVSPLTSEEVVRALGSLRIVLIDRAIAKGDTGRGWFPAPITREGGTGWRADVELPRGAVASEVMEKREELAAALTRPLGCVWPEVNAEVHPGRLVLFVADRDLSRASQKPWPLLKSGKVDLFQQVPVGTDPRGRAVFLTLMFASMVVGAIPRMGKTFALRLFLLAACLDPRAWVLAFDMKGTGDLSPLEPVAHRYRAGDEDDDIAYCLAAMREMRTEMRRRTKVIRDLPRDICPENKVTPELANKKALGLHPIVIGVDECQVWFEHAQYGSEFEEICTDLVKRGPATGITLILATQRPDAKSIPSGISANAVLRFCLKVMGHTENDMVLGTGAFRNGTRATMFSRRDKGIGYLAGEGDDPIIAKTHYIDGPAAERIVTRARGLREKAGALTGHAAGQQVDTASIRRDTILDDVLAVLPEAEPKAWTETVADRLAGLRPDVYAELTRDQLVAALKPYEVPTSRQVWGTDPATGKGVNRRGIDRSDILKAVTKRDQNKQS